MEILGQMGIQLCHRPLLQTGDPMHLTYIFETTVVSRKLWNEIIPVFMLFLIFTVNTLTQVGTFQIYNNL